MQLSTLVLPAPFGPTRANSSPGRVANDTSSRTLKPPNRSVRRSTARSAIPPPAAAILLDGAVAPPLAAGVAEVELLDVRVAPEPVAVAVEHDAPVLHDVTVVGDVERDRGALLDHQDRHAELAADVEEPPHQIVDDDRGEAERQLVHQQEVGPTHDGACEREHLPLAAGQEAADAAPQFAEAGEELVGELLGPPALRRAGSARERRDQILVNRQIREHLVALGDKHDTAPRDLVRRPVL